MQLLDLTLPTPAENVALDEALLDEAENATVPRECLRLWESDQPLVVVGRNSQVDIEVNEEYCRAQHIPIIRRTSGGCTIVAGPGCLMYAVILSYDLHPELRLLDEAHRFVLETTLTGLREVAPRLSRQGTSDLTMGPLKFSGNSLRCRRRALVYHGTLLYNFSLDLVGQCLRFPPRQPDYRRDRSHDSFITNLPTTATTLKQSLMRAWQAQEPRDTWPQQLVTQFVSERFGQDAWNLRR